MTPRLLQRRLCRLGRLVAPADMREWAEGMAREIEEIDDDRAALQWATACVMACAAHRLRAILRIAATAARYALGGYCLVVSGQVAIELVGQVAAPQIDPWRLVSWLLIGLFFGATAPLVALRRRAAAWTLAAATATTATIFTANIGGAPTDAAAQELTAAAAMVGAFLILTAVAFWLTRRPDADLTV